MRVREYVEIADRSSLDAVIDSLVALRNKLPSDSDPILRMQGDDVFGRRLSVSFLRPQTQEEAACDARYATVPATAESESTMCPPEGSGQGLSLAA